MGRFALIVALVLAHASLAQAIEGAQPAPLSPTTEKIVPVPMLIDAKKENVSSFFTKPDRCDKSSKSETCQYLSGAVQIVFRQGRATSITVFPTDAYPQTTSLEQLMLPVDHSADDVRRDMMVWRRIPGIKDVTAFRTGQYGERVWYFFVRSINY